MTQPTLSQRILEVVQECEADWQERLQSAEQRIRELQEENAQLLEEPSGSEEILDEIADTVLRKRLEPFLAVKELPLDTLIREAGIVLEARLRTASQADTRLVGVDLVDKALKPPDPIISFSSHPGEQEGVRMLYRGAMQFIRNPPMHRQIQYAESTVRLFLRLIDSLLLLLSEHEPRREPGQSLEDCLNHIRDTKVRQLAEQVVEEIQAWDPEWIGIAPLTKNISIWYRDWRIAKVVPRLGYFNIYTNNSVGEWTRYRVNREGDVQAVLAVVRESFERVRSAQGEASISVPNRESST